MDATARGGCKQPRHVRPRIAPEPRSAREPAQQGVDYYQCQTHNRRPKRTIQSTARHFNKLPATERAAGGGGGAVTSVNTTAVAVSTGNPLVITPTTGAVLVTPQRYNGFTNEGFVPRGGGATTFLRGDGSWAIPPGGAGVTNLTAAYAPSTGLPMDLSAATGAITISSYAYTGGTNVGHVPTGGLGDPNRSLRGDGTWAVQDVTSVTAGAPSASTGSPITIAPTSGAVVVTSKEYAGANNVGHVPTGGTATSYLAGDGTWSAPKQTFQVIDYLHNAVEENTPKYVGFFATCKMWDDSWKVIEHTDFTDKPFIDGDEENWWSLRYNMSIDEMNEINDKVESLDVHVTHQYNCLLYTSPSPRDRG